MALVFFGILVLWLMMAMLVRIFTDKPKNAESEAALLEDADELGKKRLAAAIAVATALEMQNSSILFSSHKERENISAWQAANRSQQLNKSRSSLSRKI